MPQGNSYPGPTLPLNGAEQFTIFQQQGAIVSTCTASIADVFAVISDLLFIVPTGTPQDAISLADFGANVLLSNARWLFNPLAQNQESVAQTVNIAQYAYTGGEPSGYQTNTFIGLGTHNPNTGGEGSNVQNTVIGWAAGNAYVSGNNTIMGYAAGNNGSYYGQDTLIGSRAGLNFLGGFNTLIGSNAGASLNDTSGVGIWAIQNTVVGHGAMGGLDTGSYVPATAVANVAVGTWAFQGNISGSNSIGIGTSVAPMYNVGNYNVMIGHQIAASAGATSATNISGCVLIGGLVLGNSTHASAISSSTIVGAFAGQFYNSTNLQAFGYEAAQNTTTGIGSTALGYQTLFSSLTDNFNTAVGHISQYHTSGGSFNTSTGAYSLQNNLTGNNNSVFGYFGFQDLLSGTYNVGGGAYVAQYAKDASQNVIFGGLAGYSTVSGTNNTILGYGAGSLGATFYATAATTVLTVTSMINGANHIAVGNGVYVAGVLVSTIASFGTGSGTIGTYNLSSSLTYSTSTPMGTADYTNTIVIGQGANAAGSNQIVIGGSSISSAQISNLLIVNGNNSGFGYGAMAVATTGFHNTGLGRAALGVLTTGAQNTATGQGAAAAIITVNDTSAFGYNTLNVATGAGNTALGSQAGLAITSGTWNTLVGAYTASTGLVTGSFNVVIGNNAGMSGDFSQCTVVGYGATASASNQVVIGTSSDTVNLGGSFSLASGSTGAAKLTGSIGIFGATAPAAKIVISGSRGSATAAVLESFLQAMVSYGYITDSTTA